jgi:nucleoside-diphosphate-sugar epimerase
VHKKIFITGGAGYVGCRLVPFLLERGYEVTVYDIMYFTDQFLDHNNPDLKIINGDIRDIQKLAYCLQGHDILLHLACIANDASFDLDENLSKTINFDCFEEIVFAAKKNGIKRFIYASSSSVYGVSDQKNVKEEHPLLPLTLYNKFKGMCEPLLLKNASKDFEVSIFRPATVCGHSPRMRFDLSVNILTCHAICNNKIRVFGGNQLRPNLHILDYCEAVLTLVQADKEKIHKEIFNVGYENLSIKDIANKIKFILENKHGYQNIEIETVKSDDNRSYHINSDKIFERLGFKPKLAIEDAVTEIVNVYNNNLYSDPMNNKIYYNVKKLLDIKAN